MGAYPLQLTGDEWIQTACLPFASEKGFFSDKDKAQLLEELRLFGINSRRRAGESLRTITNGLGR